MQREFVETISSRLLNGCRQNPRIKAGRVIPEKVRILLVDDEDVITFGFSRVLAGPGVKVDCAESVEKAKTLILAHDYAAAMVDLRISNSSTLDGIDVVRQLRQYRQECKIIVLTAYSEEGVRKQVMSAGADLLLEKPVDPWKFREILQAMKIL